jgi:glutathione peroxidase
MYSRPQARPTALPPPAALLLGLAMWATSASAGLDAMIDAHGMAGPIASDPPVTSAPTQRPSPPLQTMVADAATHPAACPPLLQHAFAPIQGGPPQSLCRYAGSVLLVVNTASQCGFTYQYEGLESLHRRFRGKGLVVVGFPSNDFGGQEPGSNKDIAEFCRTKYGVQFPMYEKASVTRLDENPLYAELAARSGAKPRWNFHKYLIDRTGERVQSFASDVEPASPEIVRAIERLLAAPRPALRS